jgi:protein SCO1/2
VVLVIAASGVGIWALTARQDETYAWNGTAYGSPRPVEPFTLTDTTGTPLSLDDLQGKPVLLYFGYTYCPDFCPATLTDFQRVKEQLGDRGDDIAYVMVTVDPARDTPERLKEYLDFFDPAFIGLTGSEDEIMNARREFGVSSGAESATPASGDDYLVSHSTQTYLLNQQGELVLEYAWGTDPAKISEDLEHMLDS